MLFVIINRPTVSVDNTLK